MFVIKIDITKHLLTNLIWIIWKIWIDDSIIDDPNSFNKKEKKTSFFLIKQLSYQVHIIKESSVQYLCTTFH